MKEQKSNRDRSLIELRDKFEIQKAHDILHSIIDGELSKLMHENDMGVIYALCDLLCWILKHEENKRFEEFFNSLINYLRSLGYEFNMLPRN